MCYVFLRYQFLVSQCELKILEPVRFWVWALGKPQVKWVINQKRLKLSSWDQLNFYGPELLCHAIKFTIVVEAVIFTIGDF